MQFGDEVDVNLYDGEAPAEGDLSTSAVFHEELQQSMVASGGRSYHTAVGDASAGRSYHTATGEASQMTTGPKYPAVVLVVVWHHKPCAFMSNRGAAATLHATHLCAGGFGVDTAGCDIADANPGA